MAGPSLTPRQARAWRAFHQMRIHLLGHLSRQLARDCQLTEAEFQILVTLLGAPERRMRARAVSLELEWDASRLSHQVTRMQSRGLLAREPCADDARAYDVVLTPAGLETIRTALPIHMREIRHCFADVLSAAQLDALTDIADTIVGHLVEQHGLETSHPVRAAS